ncbi:hypothetical protein DXG01_015171, partial [Tephrocybe rancida]
MRPTGEKHSTAGLRPVLQKLSCHPLSKPSSQEARILEQIAYLVSSIRSDSPTTPPQRVELLSIETGYTQMKYLIDGALEVHNHTVKAPTKWQLALMKDPNRLCPFREFIPSRNLFCAEDGPFSKQHAHTDVGALSALTWRGVTFGTKFSEVEIKIFPTVKDWDQARERHSEEPDSFFCNQQAYGQHCEGRGVSLVAEYAEALTTNSWAT